MRSFLCALEKSSLKGGWRKPAETKQFCTQQQQKKVNCAEKLIRGKRKLKYKCLRTEKMASCSPERAWKEFRRAMPCLITEHRMHLQCISNHPSGDVHLLFQKDKLLQDQMLESTKSRIVHTALWTTLAWMLHFSPLMADNTGEVLTKFVNQVTIMWHKHVHYANMIA